MKRIVLFLMMAAFSFPFTGCKSAVEPDGDVFTTKNGTEISFTCIKHASVGIQVGDKWIYVDPVIKASGTETDYSVFPKADYIVVTHDHYDHFDSLAVEQLSREGTVFVADPSSVEALGRGVAMRNGDSYDTVEGWKIEAVPAYNTSEEKLQFHPKGRDNGYIITVDGFRMYFGGDLEVIPELSDVKDIDVAFLPCNLPFTMTPEQCNEAARIVAPKVLFPYHYGDTDIQKLVDLLAGSGMDVRIRQYQ